VEGNLDGGIGMSALKQFWQDEDGQGMVEYGLIVGIISVAVIASLTSMKDSLVKLFQTAAQNLETGASSAGSH
jgi:pilus assembly protein Flp/PilA